MTKKIKRIKGVRQGSAGKVSLEQNNFTPKYYQEDLICINIMQRGVVNVNPMKMARCIIELERIKGIQNGGDRGNQYKVADGNNFDVANQKELCVIRHWSFNVKGNNMIGERQIVHHKMTQSQIAKELCGVYHGGDRSSKRQFVVSQEQVAKELCGVYHGNHISKESGKVCLSQEDIAKQLGVSPRYLKNMKS